MSLTASGMRAVQTQFITEIYLNILNRPCLDFERTVVRRGCSPLRRCRCLACLSPPLPCRCSYMCPNTTSSFRHRFNIHTAPFCRGEECKQNMINTRRHHAGRLQRSLEMLILSSSRLDIRSFNIVVSRATWILLHI